MDKLAKVIAGAPSVRNNNDDDLIDRLNSRYSVVILILFSLLVGMNQYVRNPITCWAPVHFTGPHTKFATNYCWVKNTYYLPWQHEVPMETEEKQMIPYYQWIPFILLFQAILFYFPSVVWHSFNSKAGIDADSIIQGAHNFYKINNFQHQERVLIMMRNQFDRFLSNRIKPKKCDCSLNFISGYGCFNLCGRRLNMYLVLLFLTSKILYITNIIFQLFFLNKVLSIKFNSFGFDYFHNLIQSDDWNDGNFVAFPHVTYCDFLIRGQDLANVQRYSIQCVLPINLYNEKIYLFLWFWMIFLLFLSCFSFFIWLLRTLVFKDRLKFIRNHLILGGKIEKGRQIDEQQVENFTKNYLKQDGVLLCRLISHNTNNITTTEIICNLWLSWKQKIVNDVTIVSMESRLTSSSTLRSKEL